MMVNLGDRIRNISPFLLPFPTPILLFIASSIKSSSDCTPSNAVAFALPSFPRLAPFLFPNSCAAFPFHDLAESRLAQPALFKTTSAQAERP